MRKGEYRAGNKFCEESGGSGTVISWPDVFKNTNISVQVLNNLELDWGHLLACSRSDLVMELDSACKLPLPG